MFSKRFRVVVVAIMIASFFLFGYSWFMQKQSLVVDYSASRDRTDLLNIFDQNVFWLAADPDSMSAHNEFERQLDTATSSEFCTDKGNLCTLVYRDAGVAKGFVSYYKLSPVRAKILYVAVHNDHRRQGLAAQLLKHAVDKLEKSGIKQMELLTRVVNTRAQGLYHKLGFVPVRADGTYVVFERG